MPICPIPISDIIIGLTLLLSLDGVVPSQMVGVSASVNLPLHHKAQKFSSGTGSPRWSRKKGCKMVVVVACGMVGSLTAHMCVKCNFILTFEASMRLSKYYVRF